VTSTIFGSLIRRTRLPWNGFVGLLGLAFAAGGLGSAYLDGVLGEVFRTNTWRALFAYPTITVYMLAIIPLMERVGADADAARQSLLDLDDDESDRLAIVASSASPRSQWTAFGIGAAFGLLSTFSWLISEPLSWMGLYAAVASLVTGGLLAWSIYSAMVGARSTTAFHSWPIKVDIFDIRPFQQISRHSLTSALAFFGGGAISLFFAAWGRGSPDFPTLVFYGFLVLVAALAFFLPTSATHRVLASAKGEELIRVRQHIVAAYRSLEDLSPESKDLGLLPTKLNLWKEYEARVKATRTWPYDLSMLRTFAFSVLTPVAITYAQRLLSQLLNL
jgi:hypothetical protein